MRFWLGNPTAVSAPRSGKWAAELFPERRQQRTFYTKLFSVRAERCRGTQYRADSELKAQEYSGPILGLIFLRFAEVRFAAALPR